MDMPKKRDRQMQSETVQVLLTKYFVQFLCTKTPRFIEQYPIFAIIN